ncbi:MAG TPA: 2Fe-2S iron-sulfur cluster-binding protein [Kofleriaceae bacterium]|jgi:ferredoxin|nr:2Fe-2S iron-sulfur cluster-binding protein [Kofleriaceae bacterium]
MPVITIVDPETGPATVEVPTGSTLFDAGAKLSAGIDTSCVGKGTCGLCRVKILAGAEHLPPFTDEERKHLGNVYHITKVRLSCRCVVSGDVTIEVVRRKKK